MFNSERYLAPGPIPFYGNQIPPQNQEISIKNENEKLFQITNSKASQYNQYVPGIKNGVSK